MIIGIVFELYDIEGIVVEYIEWDLLKSKLSAAILYGARNIWIISLLSLVILYPMCFYNNAW